MPEPMAEIKPITKPSLGHTAIPYFLVALSSWGLASATGQEMGSSLRPGQLWRPIFFSPSSWDGAGHLAAKCCRWQSRKVAGAWVPGKLPGGKPPKQQSLREAVTWARNALSLCYSSELPGARFTFDFPIARVRLWSSSLSSQTCVWAWGQSPHWLFPIDWLFSLTFFVFFPFPPFSLLSPLSWKTPSKSCDSNLSFHALPLKGLLDYLI